VGGRHEDGRAGDGMQLSRIVIKNFRSLKFLDVQVAERTTCIIGENNTGKSNLIQALRLCLDVNLSSAYRALVKDDMHADVDQRQPFQVLIGVEFKEFEGRDNEEAMLHGTQIGQDRARLFYRFRRNAPREKRSAFRRGCLTHSPWRITLGSWSEVAIRPST
jgi:putative ATP-dependent endonuclease of the OLD family